MYFDKSSSCLYPSKEKILLGDRNVTGFMHMASHMPELSVCIIYANF